MFEKYLLLGILQLALFVLALPIVVGVLLGLIVRERAEKRLWRAAITLILLVNVAVLIDKGLPFFTAQVVDVYLPFSLPIWQRLLIGLIGDALLCLSFRRSLGRGFRSGLHLIGGSSGAGAGR